MRSRGVTRRRQRIVPVHQSSFASIWMYDGGCHIREFKVCVSHAPWSSERYHIFLKSSIPPALISCICTYISDGLLVCRCTGGERAHVFHHCSWNAAIGVLCEIGINEASRIYGMDEALRQLRDKVLISY